MQEQVFHCIHLFKTNRAVALLLTSMTLLVGCHYDNIQKTTKMYVAGSVDDEPTYWINDIPTSIAIEGPYGTAIDLAVIGNDVYTIVRAFYNGFPSDLIYKNQSLLYSPAELGEGLSITGICAEGRDLYFCGRSNGTGKYWKNGQLISLGPDDYPTDIKVVGSDVYICGNNRIQGGAKWWRNGVETVLPGGNLAYAIDVKGSNIYVLSSHAYWRNDTFINIPTVSNPDPLNIISRTITLTDIVIHNDEVYLTGSLDDYHWDVYRRHPYYWYTPILVRRDSVAIFSDYASAGAPVKAFFESVTADANAIYVSGLINEGGSYVAAYWKNDELVELTRGTKESRARKILIK